MPTFSIIVPIYNVGSYLRQCVDSILNQTYKDFEVVLVDDGSPDNCPAICDEYAEKDDRVKVIHKSNGGLVSARKAGAEEACGRYIVCVDGDDWIDDRHLESFFSIIEDCSPDIIVDSAVRAFEDESLNYSNGLPYRKGYYTKDDIKKEIYPLLIQNEYARYFAPSIWAKAYRAELYKKMQLAVSDQIKIGEDGACTIPCVYYAESIFITDSSTYYYRQNPTSMTKEKKAFSWAGPEMIHKHIQSQIDMDQYDLTEQLHRKTVHELFLVVVSQFNRQESYRTIVKDIKAHLQGEIYSECIKNAKFKSLKGRFAVLSMRYRLYFLIWVFSRVK